MEEIISQDLKMIQLGVETMGVENMQHDVFSLTEKNPTDGAYFLHFFFIVRKLFRPR